MRSLEILPGHKFGSLVVIEEAPRKFVGNRFRRAFRVRCESKKEHVMELDSLQEGVRCKCYLNKNFPWYVIDGLKSKIITIEQAMKLSNITYAEALNLKKGKNE